MNCTVNASFMKFSKKTWTYYLLYTLLSLSVPPYGRSNKNCKRRLWLPKLSITLLMNYCVLSRLTSWRWTLIMHSAESLSSRFWLFAACWKIVQCYIVAGKVSTIRIASLTAGKKSQCFNKSTWQRLQPVIVNASSRTSSSSRIPNCRYDTVRC